MTQYDSSIAITVSQKIRINNYQISGIITDPPGVISNDKRLAALPPKQRQMPFQHSAYWIVFNFTHAYFYRINEMKLNERHT